MQHRYQDSIIPEAYERLLLDAIHGNQQHFVRRRVPSREMCVATLVTQQHICAGMSATKCMWNMHGVHCACFAWRHKRCSQRMCGATAVRADRGARDLRLRELSSGPAGKRKEAPKT